MAVERVLLAEALSRHESLVLAIQVHGTASTREEILHTAEAFHNFLKKDIVKGAV